AVLELPRHDFTAGPADSVQDPHGPRRIICRIRVDQRRDRRNGRRAVGQQSLARQKLRGQVGALETLDRIHRIRVRPWFLAARESFLPVGTNAKMRPWSGLLYPWPPTPPSYQSETYSRPSGAAQMSSGRKYLSPSLLKNTSLVARMPKPASSWR